jgi:glyoxylase-like metal-dependent hydrolase (beta-lactamase superfamily II)
MKIYPIEAGNFKLDGGAMFGVVPKTIWNKTNPADSNNLIDIAARCLLIEDGNRLILIDTGMGNKQSEKFFSYYSLWGNHSLDKSLELIGFHRDDITAVSYTHLRAHETEL